MPRFALALLIATGCAGTRPPPVPTPQTIAQPRKHPMVGDWVGSLRVRYTRAGEAPLFDEKPFALKLDNAPRSLGGAASPCNLRAIPEGDSVRFPVGQRCVGSLADKPFGTTLRDGTLQIVDGKLRLALVFDTDDGDEIVVDGSLARRM